MVFSTSNLSHSKKKKVDNVEDTGEEVHRTHNILNPSEKLSIMVYLIDNEYINSDYELDTSLCLIFHLD
jgi:hypothetical protein